MSNREKICELLLNAGIEEKTALRLTADILELFEPCKEKKTDTSGSGGGPGKNTNYGSSFTSYSIRDTPGDF